MTTALWRPAPRWAGMLAAAVLSVSGCTGSGDPVGSTSGTSMTSTVATTSDPPSGTPSETEALTTTPTSSSPTSPTAPTTSEQVTIPPEASALPLPADNSTVDALNPQEVADRTAIEAVWRRAWDLYSTIDDVPASERPAEVGAVMLDPLKSQLLQGAAKDDAEGITSYGSITLHPYWYRGVDGKPYAVIGDCRDVSAFGDVSRTTGDKISVGVKNSNTVGQFIRTTDGWKLWNVTYVTDVPCTAA